MKLVLALAQIICSLLLVVAITLQGKGSGLSSVFGGRSAYQTKRGVEKLLFRFTILLVAVFIIVSILGVAVG